MASYHAIVAGATGATGREAVAALLRSSRCTKITALVRSKKSAEAKLAETPAGEATDAAARAEKLVLVEVDWEVLAEAAPEAEAWAPVRGAALALNCLGTTRKDAGGASGFRRVDLDYYTAFARAARAAGVPAYAQVSAAGASEGSWLLYPQTKGKADAVARDLGFERCWVLRPGLLDRGSERRGVEGCLMKLPGVGATSVAAVGRAMVNGYERSLGGAHNIVSVGEMKGSYA